MDKLKRYCDKGIELYKSNRYTEALDEFNKVLQINPSDHEACFYKAVVLTALKRLNDAVLWYDMSIKNGSKNHNLFNNKGLVLHDLGLMEEAIKSFDESIKIKPDAYFVYNNKGTSLYKSGKLDEAIECYNKAIELKQDYHPAHNNLGYVFELMNRYDDAMKCYDKAIELSPNYLLAKNNKNRLKQKTSLKPEDSNYYEYPYSDYPKMPVKPAQPLNEKDGPFDIFLSYSWEQQKEVETLYHILTKEGFKCWMDHKELLVGDELYEALTAAIRNSRIIVTCLSKSYISSVNCNREFFFASGRNKTIIPIIMATDKKAEFGSWLPDHKIFFRLADTIYFTGIYEHLKGPYTPTTNYENTRLEEFIKQLKQIVNT